MLIFLQIYVIALALIFMAWAANAVWWEDWFAARLTALAAGCFLIVAGIFSGESSPHVTYHALIRWLVHVLLLVDVLLAVAAFVGKRYKNIKSAAPHR